MAAKKDSEKKGLKLMSMMNKTIYLKIFMNYLQVISLSKGFNLNWPGELITVFKVQGQASQIAEQVFALDCFIASIKPFNILSNHIIL